jgi:hypothetical protein
MTVTIQEQDVDLASEALALHQHRRTAPWKVPATVAGSQKCRGGDSTADRAHEHWCFGRILRSEAISKPEESEVSIPSTLLLCRTCVSVAHRPAADAWETEGGWLTGACETFQAFTKHAPSSIV